MAIFISRRQVFNNLLRFKHGLSGHVQTNSIDKRIYKAMMNFQTGDIQFPEAHPTNFTNSDWKEIELEVKSNKQSDSVFEAKDWNNQPLDSDAMAPIAWKVMVETIRALNQITSQYPKPDLPPEQVAIEGIDREISSFRAIEVMPGWIGKVNRYQAESSLQAKSVGTYLLRNGDKFTEVIAQNLIEANKFCVEVFLCTVVELENKISDILILMTEMGWTFYRDNPDLSDTEYVYHESPEKLLSCLGKRIKHPVS